MDDLTTSIVGIEAPNEDKRKSKSRMECMMRSVARTVYVPHAFHLDDNGPVFGASIRFAVRTDLYRTDEVRQVRPRL